MVRFLPLLLAFALAVELLADVGIEEPNPNFAQVIETDLDGDGAAETLAVLDQEAGRGHTR